MGKEEKDEESAEGGEAKKEKTKRKKTKCDKKAKIYARLEKVVHTDENIALAGLYVRHQ